MRRRIPSYDAPVTNEARTSPPAWPRPVELDSKGIPSVEVGDDYARAIAWAESLPQNQSGADKSWIVRAFESFRHTHTRLRLVGR
jgi:hypothetical protein